MNYYKDGSKGHTEFWSSMGVCHLMAQIMIFRNYL